MTKHLCYSLTSSWTPHISHQAPPFWPSFADQTYPLILTSGPLHLLFFLPGIPVLQISICLDLSCCSELCLKDSTPKSLFPTAKLVLKLPSFIFFSHFYYLKAFVCFFLALSPTKRPRGLNWESSRLSLYLCPFYISEW